jgi:tetratricopeptide (TPR) repeat protein
LFLDRERRSSDNRWRMLRPGYRALSLLVACALLAVVTESTRRDGQAHYQTTQRYEDVYYLPPPEWLMLFSLGEREALAGLIWLRALVYFGDEVQRRGEVQHLYRYADAMLALDASFKRVYQWTASSAIYRTGHVSAEDVRRAIEYLERAVRLFPDDGELAWMLGATYLYELPQLLPPTERDEPRRRGLEHLQVAARLGAGPPWLVLTTATALHKLGQREQEIAHLQEVYDQISDPQVKEQIEMRLTALRSSAFAEALRRTNEELERRRIREYPYLTRELYQLVGPKPPFDGRALLLRGFDPESEHFDDEGDGAESAAAP